VRLKFKVNKSNIALAKFQIELSFGGSLNVLLDLFWIERKSIIENTIVPDASSKNKL
jgi:hypothetical protein